MYCYIFKYILNGLTYWQKIHFPLTQFLWSSAFDKKVHIETLPLHKCALLFSEKPTLQKEDI